MSSDQGWTRALGTGLTAGSIALLLGARSVFRGCGCCCSLATQRAAKEMAFSLQLWLSGLPGSHLHGSKHIIKMPWLASKSSCSITSSLNFFLSPRTILCSSTPRFRLKSGRQIWASQEDVDEGNPALGSLAQSKALYGEGPKLSSASAAFLVVNHK